MTDKISNQSYQKRMYILRQYINTSAQLQRIAYRHFGQQKLHKYLLSKPAILSHYIKALHKTQCITSNDQSIAYRLPGR